MIPTGKDEKGRSLSASTIATSASSQIAALGPEVLLHALNSGQANDVAMILKDGEVDPNFQTGKAGMYPLHVAAARGDHVSMALLLTFRANIEARDYRGKTPLHIAAKNDRADALQLLVSKKADPNAHDNAGRTALWYAAGHGTSHSALALLTSLSTAVINHRCADSAMPTPLWAAAAMGQVDTATTLLRAGADPNATDAQESTLLHKAGWPAAATLTPLLLEHGADATARDREGKLPLHRAAEEGRTGIAARLLRLTDVDSRAGDDATALIHAAERGKLRMCRFLAEHGHADWQLCDKDGNDAFYVACSNGHVLCATYLLGLARGGRDVSAGNSMGNTALHAAARWGHVELVRWLLDLGADRGALSTRDSPGVGVTPAQAARRAANESVERESTRQTEVRRARQEEIAKLIDEFALDDGPVQQEVEITRPSSQGLPGSGDG
jgi:ankyrin repeat protein